PPGQPGWLAGSASDGSRTKRQMHGIPDRSTSAANTAHRIRRSSAIEKDGFPGAGRAVYPDRSRRREPNESAQGRTRPRIGCTTDLALPHPDSRALSGFLARSVFFGRVHESSGPADMESMLKKCVLTLTLVFGMAAAVAEPEVSFTGPARLGQLKL